MASRGGIREASYKSRRRWSYLTRCQSAETASMMRTAIPEKMTCVKP
ncbi:hypothetical protein [Paenibacillus dendritiformis]|nr:hypothetical protein [Paenibacillus dendritiformis]